MIETIDLCVIGGGDSGFSAAMAGAALGLRVTLIDERAPHAAPQNDELVCAVLQRESRERLHVGRAKGDLAWTKPLREALERAAPDRRLARLSAMNIQVIQGRAGFSDPHTVSVEAHTIQARRFIIASGSEQVGWPGVAQDRVLSLANVHRLSSFPAHLHVVGGDPISVSVAQSICRLGATVTLSATGGVLPDFDPELVLPLHTALLQDGVVLREPAQGPVLRTTNSGVAIEQEETLGVASRVFLPRTAPALSDLRLDRAGIALTGDGGLVLTPSLRTTNPRVYAIGSVANAYSRPAAQVQVGTVMKSAFLRLPARYDPSNVPVCVATEPSIAMVGLSEDRAREREEVRVWRWPFAETTAGWARDDTNGHLKVITDRRSRILGVGIVGPEAAEQIGFWTLALQQKLTMQQLAEVPLPLPSLSEAFRRTALLQAATRFQNPWFKRALALMGRFG